MALAGSSLCRGGVCLVRRLLVKHHKATVTVSCTSLCGPNRHRYSAAIKGLRTGAHCTGIQRHYSIMASDSVKNFKVVGVTTAPVTPFAENGDLNLDLIPRYVDHLLDYGIPNAFVAGTTGEGNNMTVAERKLVAEAWVNSGKGRLSAIIVHIGAGNLRDSQELARHAESIGVDAISCVGPTYHKPESLAQYVAYMKDVAASAPKTPFYLYDIDFVTGIPYAAWEFFRAAADQIPTLRGLKHTSPDLVSMRTILDDHAGRFQVIMGTEEYYLEGLALGVDGTICQSFFGRLLNRIKSEYDRGDMDAARRSQILAVRVHKQRQKHGFSVPGFTKAMCQVLGLPVGSPRSPLSPLTPRDIETVRGIAKGTDFIET